MRDVLLTLLVLFASAFVLSDCDEDEGCDAEPVQSLTLQPIATQTMLATIADEDDFSCWPFYCTCLCHLTVGCTVKADGSKGEVQAGDQRWRDEGTDPCPCAWYRNCVSRGWVLFDLSTLAGEGRRRRAAPLDLPGPARARDPGGGSLRRAASG